ncbi:hypothetical protein GDO86_016733 [Hymenochirus boettgeri]|uniref:G-protein coupled receptors family 1 profile domain-containing protein n=1 Tax=Hymenochirus boettgeri TaxID=247094 RepID=A0A8T2IHL7_9PIPI|nr:hypothetical protein GDO86_016733 [Hymenochirus boettgeri]
MDLDPDLDPCALLIDHQHVPEFEARLAVKVSLTLLYGLILVAGVLGNVVTIRTTRVLLEKGYLQKGVTEHMTSLACSDLLVLLLGMPVELYSVVWFPFSPTGNVPCKIFCFLFETCSYATLFHVGTLSLERYVAVCHPFSFRKVSGSGSVKMMIGLSWVTSVFVALPFIFSMGAEYPLSPVQGYSARANCSSRTAPSHLGHNRSVCTSLSHRWTVFQSSIFTGFIIYILVLGSVAFMCRRMMVTLMATNKGTVIVKGNHVTGTTSDMTRNSSSEAKAARKQTIVFLGWTCPLTLTWFTMKISYERS